jgi:toxin CptA
MLLGPEIQKYDAMEIALTLIAVTAIGIMGFANQRGSICTVVAIEQIVRARRFDRLFALIDVSFWVGGGMVMLKALGLLPAVPIGYTASALTVLGGAVFGLGAFVNRACLLGTVARIGSGQWAFLATPPGFYIGAVATRHLSYPLELTGAPLVLRLPEWSVPPIAALLLIRLLAYARLLRRGDGSAGEHAWPPRVATAVMGLAFLATAVTVGRWSYSDILSDLARGSAHAVGAKLLLVAILLGGAILGGYTAGLLKPVGPHLSTLSRCLVGGAIMGVGSTFIPGGNDGLVMMGMPLLWPYAWLAFVSMCLTIFAATVTARPSGKLDVNNSRTLDT